MKGDARMAAVIAGGGAGRRSACPDDGLAVGTTWGTARVDADDVRRHRRTSVARGVPHNVGRGAFRTRLARLVRADLVRRRGEEVVTTEAVEADLRRDRAWGAALDRIWPALSAPPSSAGC